MSAVAMRYEINCFCYIQKQPPEVFLKGVLRNFAKFTGKHLCQSLIFNKVAGMRPATLLKRRFWRRCFPVSVRRCPVKNVFIKVSQNSQESTCVRVSFLIKKDSGTGFLL